MVSYYIYVTLLIVNIILYGRLIILNRKAKFQLLFFYLVTMLLIEFISNGVARVFGNNLFFSHIYYGLHGSILFLFYLKTNLNNKQKRIIKFFFCLIIGILSFQYFLYPEILMRVNPLEVVLVNYLLILCSLFYFYNTLGNKRKMFGNGVRIGMTKNIIIKKLKLIPKEQTQETQK